MTDSATCEHAGTPRLRGNYKAVFFDLDGTLLPMELESFMGAYMGSLGEYMGSAGIDPKAGLSALGAGVKAMMEGDGSMTNRDAFWHAFDAVLAAHPEAIAAGSEAQRRIAAGENLETLIAPYYETVFGGIGANTEANPASAQAVETLAAKGYRLVLATMPMFPRRAVEWRLQWAGISGDAFELITTYENSRSTKPRTSYYRNILEATGLSAEDVLMVGNNTREDGAAAKIGCDMFLVTDFLIEGEDGLDVERTPHGTMAEFAELCATFPQL